MPSQEYSFQSFYLSDRFQLRELEGLLQRTAVATDRTRCAFKNNAGDGYFFVFNFGALCFFNVAKDEQQEIIRLLTTRYGQVKQTTEWDEFMLEVVPSKRTRMRVDFDRAVVNALSFERIDVVALIVTESVALDHFETMVDDLLEKSHATAETLSHKGRLPGSAKAVNRSIGISMATKQHIVSSLYLLDKPDILWEDEALEKLYHGLFGVFEIRERFSGIEYKLRTLQENMALVSSLVASGRTERLEMIIVLLILLEIVLFSYELFLR